MKKDDHKMKNDNFFETMKCNKRNNLLGDNSTKY